MAHPIILAAAATAASIYGSVAGGGGGGSNEGVLGDAEAEGLFDSLAKMVGTSSDFRGISEGVFTFAAEQNLANAVLSLALPSPVVKGGVRLRVIVTDDNLSLSTGDVTIVGTDGYNMTVTETLHKSSGTGSEVLVGSVSFYTVSSITASNFATIDVGTDKIEVNNAYRNPSDALIPWHGMVNRAIEYNPWQAAVPYDPSSSPFDPGTALDSVKSSVSDMARTQWNNLVEDAITAREVEGVFETVDSEMIADAAVQMALEQATLGWDETYRGTSQDVAHHFDLADDKAQTILTSIRNFIASGIREDMATEIRSAQTWARTTALEALTDSDVQVNADARDDLNSAHTAAQLNLSTILSNAGSAATTAVSSALSAALSEAALAANSDLVSDATDAYEARSTHAYMRTVSQFAGGMRDINAVNSSAFIFGLSNLAAERQHDLAKYDADLAAQMYQQAMAIAATVFTHSFDRYYDIYMGKLDLYFKQLAIGQAEYIRTFLMNLGERLQTYRSLIPSYLQADTSLVGQHTATSTNFTNSFLQDFRNHFDSYVHSMMATELQTSNNKDAFLLSAVTDQFNMLQSRIQGYRDEALLEQEMNRIYNAEQRIYKEDDFAYRERDAKWALEILKYPQNLLGAASGGTTSPESVPLGRAVLGSTISFAANYLAMKDPKSSPNNIGRAGGSGGLGSNLSLNP